MSKEKDHNIREWLAFFYCITWAGILSLFGSLTLEFAGVITASYGLAKFSNTMNLRCKNKTEVALKNGMH